MATFVLVHGAYHGAWCYARVAPMLRAAKHEVYVPSLSGVGERRHMAGLPINLSTHVQDVVAFFETHDLRDVILCGHSYGGTVVTGVAGQVGDRIKTLVYIDAGVPEDGQSAFDVAGPERAWLLLQAAGETGTAMPPPPPAYFGVGPADVATLEALCSPHPVGCYIQKLRYTGRESLVRHRTYVLCERHRSSNHATYERVRKLADWRTIVLDRGHELMLDDPDMLAALLLDEVLRENE